ncbi:hypothetical protein HUU39_12045, partial [candidate division KSB1 bacterium]|nr:hypothetical protein [candidate division KSB1 bacterium]
MKTRAIPLTLLLAALASWHCGEDKVVTPEINAPEPLRWAWQNPLPQGNAVHGLHVFDRNTAIAVAGAGTIMKTTDGGVSWRVQHLASGVIGDLLAVHFFGNNFGVAVGKART